MKDITEALREQPARHSAEQSSSTNVDLGVLDARRIDLENPPTKPVPVIYLKGQQICTAGNLTVLSAQVKAGKSAVIGSMLASLMAVEKRTTTHLDLLGFTGQKPGGKAVVLFDTEQSPYDACSLVKRATDRAGVERLPNNFRCYHLADIYTPQRRQFLTAELKRAEETCGGIHCVFIDGVADLCADLNDSEEAFALVDELFRLAINYKCPVVNVLHENPSGRDSGKTRGHLGSQLERKAESNLRVVKDAKGVSTIYSDRCRHASISKEDGPRFAWDAKVGMHMSILNTTKADKWEKKRKNAIKDIDLVFEGVVGSIAWSNLKNRILDRCKFSCRTAERRIKQWSDLGLIVETHGQYSSTGNTTVNRHQPSKAPSLSATVKPSAAI